MIRCHLDIHIYTWQMSHLGIWEEELERGTLWCMLASLLAAWIFLSHSQHSAASSAQHSTAASAASHTLHCIFILPPFHLSLSLSLPLWKRLLPLSLSLSLSEWIPEGWERCKIWNPRNWGLVLLREQVAEPRLEGKEGFKKGPVGPILREVKWVIFFEAALALCTRGRLSVVSWRGRPALLSLAVRIYYK